MGSDTIAHLALSMCFSSNWSSGQVPFLQGNVSCQGLQTLLTSVNLVQVAATRHSLTPETRAAGIADGDAVGVQGGHQVSWPNPWKDIRSLDASHDNSRSMHINLRQVRNTCNKSHTCFWPRPNQFRRPSNLWNKWRFSCTKTVVFGENQVVGLWGRLELITLLTRKPGVIGRRTHIGRPCHGRGS